MVHPSQRAANGWRREISTALHSALLYDWLRGKSPAIITIKQSSCVRKSQPLKVEVILVVCVI